MSCPVPRWYSFVTTKKSAGLTSPWAGRSRSPISTAAPSRVRTRFWTGLCLHGSANQRGGQSGRVSIGLTVVIDHTPPVAPFPPVLEAASDTSHGFDVTAKNNSSPQNAPVFDVAQIVA